MLLSREPQFLDGETQSQRPPHAAVSMHARSFVALLKQVREDYWLHGSEWLSPGFQALAAHRFGAWLLHAPRLLRSALWPAYRMLYVRARNVYGIELPATTSVGRGVSFPHQSGIVIHWNAVIGDDCIIRQNVTLGAVNSQRIEGAPKLGNRVEVGAGVAILGRVTIGDGARIGPNAVIMTNIPAGATVVTPNARVIQLPRQPGADESRGTG